MAHATVTLRGSFSRLDGAPALGTVRVRPSVPTIRDAGTVVIAGEQRFSLDEAGAFAADLPATDDPGLDPTGFTYQVTVSLHHAHVPPVTLQLPAALAEHDISNTPVPSVVVALTETDDGLYMISDGE